MEPNPLTSQRRNGFSVWLSRLARHWEHGLLLVMLTAMIAMIASLLWPRPHAVISLRPYAANSPALALPEPATEDASNADMSDPDATDINASSGDGADALNASLTHSSRHRRAHAQGHPKKPAHPPVQNLNTASAQQLQLLTGIGPKMAQRIVEYRKANGGFKTIEQVMDVKGIGPKKFEKMKAYLRV